MKVAWSSWNVWRSNCTSDRTSVRWHTSIRNIQLPLAMSFLSKRCFKWSILAATSLNLLKELDWDLENSDVVYFLAFLVVAFVHQYRQKYVWFSQTNWRSYSYNTAVFVGLFRGHWSWAPSLLIPKYGRRYSVEWKVLGVSKTLLNILFNKLRGSSRVF